MTLDLTGTGTLPAGGHRMANQAVRMRVLLAIAGLILAGWAATSALGRVDCGAFDTTEARALAGLPVPPECVVAPPGLSGGGAP